MAMSRLRFGVSKDRRATFRPGPSHRVGVTMVEVLVVIGITSVLMGLLLPAVQNSRESARANECRHRLRQLAMSVHGFHDTHGSLPVTFHVRVGRPAFPRMLSPWAQILPFLDQTPLYHQIDQDPNEIGLGVYGNPPSLTRPANQQLLKTRLSVAMCPSDSAPAGACNFRTCISSGPDTHRLSGPGPWSYNQTDREAGFALVTDGLSQTALISERIVGDFDSTRYTPARDVYFFDRSFPMPYRPDDYAQACRSHFPSGPPEETSFSGATWLINGFAFTHYNHTLAPNSEFPDCSENEPGLYSAAVSARSWHPQAVHVAFADGHVRRISEFIDLKLWRAIATRNGAETLQLPD